MANAFNPEPIMLRNPSSLLVNTEKYQQQQEPQVKKKKKKLKKTWWPFSLHNNKI